MATNGSIVGQQITPKHCALLVIDMQNDYLHEEGICAQAGLDVEPHRAIVPIVGRVIEAAHRVGLLVIYTRNWRTHRDISATQLRRVAQRQFGFTGLADSWGAGWFSVDPDDRDVVISKTRHDAFFGTNLDQILRAQRITCLIIAGVQTHVCVESTVRSAFDRDYEVIVLKDATAAADMELHEVSLRNMAANYGNILPADTIIAAWEKESA